MRRCRFWMIPVLALGFLGFGALGVSSLSAREPAAEAPSSTAKDLLAPVRAKLDAATQALKSVSDPVAQARLLLMIGDPDRALTLVPGLTTAGLEGKVTAAEVLLAVGDYGRLGPRVQDLLGSHPETPAVRELAYRWWTIEDDLEQVDRVAKSRMANGSAGFEDRLAAAGVALALLDDAEAEAGFARALTAAASASDSARALRGLAEVLSHRRDFDTALTRLRQALRLSPPNPDLLVSLVETLIRLGRTDEAITAAETAARIAPYHERAHYFLGNGYARKNYTQLYAAYPGAFSDSAGRTRLEAADSLLAAGNRSQARAEYKALGGEHPEWADVLVRLGSLDFSRRDYAAARRWFVRALALCPEYGRAHNGLAKALEAQRLAVEVHLAEYERRFAETPMPEVPGIERFVLNWNALSPRHKKRVALSISPWKRYLPVLIEGGATFYIKPLYELLSETPGQGMLRDQRISYDSRLWDDVRGCGGYHTVTGIEDVERTIHGRYNTMLHELTHQVHGVLPAERKRAIQELYRRAKVRDQAGGEGFLSRYAGGSVWEYFAEGANSLKSPRRDAYDTREIVRERLEALDPDLESLVAELMTTVDVDSCYAVAYASRGDDFLERGKPREAIGMYRMAIGRNPGEETALAAFVFALEVADSSEAAQRLAESAAERYPGSAILAVRRAETLWTGGQGLDAAIETLRRSRAGVRGEERYRLDAALGRLLWVAGDAAGAREFYGKVLAYQEDSPEGLWGAGAALALERRWAKAWKEYEKAVRLRTGVVDLRADFARDLLRAGETERARKQVNAALLLDPDDPRCLALRGWVLLESGKPTEALVATKAALDAGPWCDLARIVRARAQTALGRREQADETLHPLWERMRHMSPPNYVYRAKWGRYERVHELPAVLRNLVTEGE